MNRPLTGRSGRRPQLAAITVAAALFVLAFPVVATAAAQQSLAVSVTNGATNGAVFADPPARLGHCHTVTVPVTLPTGQAAHLAGHLCTPAHGYATTALVLVHGATYDSAYWSWPQDPWRYSFVWQALAAGYSVVAVDRLGDGQSSRPLSTLDTFAAQAATLHQAVTAVRSGTVGNTRVAHVVLVAHSFGSAEVAQELATYPRDADAVVLTGSGHTVAAGTSALTRTGFAPASTMLPRFQGLDPGYLTSTTQQVRDLLLYRVDDSDPAVRAYDQSTRDTLALTESTTRPADLAALTRTLRIPTLLVDGQDDNHYCAAAQTTPEPGLDDCSSAAGLYTSEKANYGQCFAAGVVAGSGHDLTTEYGAQDAAALILHYVRATMSPTGAPARCAVVGPVPAHGGDDRGAGASA